MLALSWSEYDRSYKPDRLECKGELCFDLSATGFSELHVLAVCDACGFEIAVPRTVADPAWRGRFLIERSGLPDAFMDKAFARSDDNAAALEATSAWVDDQLGRKPPALHGPAGVGKTHLLSRTGAALCRAEIPVLYRDYVNLMRLSRDYIDRPAGRDPLEAVAEIEVLILDDLGAEKTTAWTAEKLQWIIDERYKAGLPILAATNLDVMQWPEEFGERTASRLAAMTEPIFMGGVDLRLA